MIKDSSASEETVTLLKAEPLTTAEVNEFGIGHVNRYTSSSVGTAYDSNGYGGMAYYTSETCGWLNNDFVTQGCTNAYNQSEVKYVVDAWASAQTPAAIEARLITKDEYLDYCVEEEYQSTPSDISTRYVPQYDWMFNNDYWYWTDTSYIDSNNGVWYVKSDGEIAHHTVDDHYGSGVGVVRPVIILPKSAL